MYLNKEGMFIMKLSYVFMITVSFVSMSSYAEFFENLGNAVGDVGRAAGDVVAAPGRIIHHHGIIYSKTGVILEGQWKGQSVGFSGNNAYIGAEERMVQIINCVPQGGMSAQQYVEGQQFFTYRDLATNKISTCKYIEIK